MVSITNILYFLCFVETLNQKSLRGPKGRGNLFLNRSKKPLLPMRLLRFARNDNL
jgi:hypothetical protein